MIGSKGMENVIDFRKSYGIITAFRCGSTVRDVSAVDFNRTKEKSAKRLTIENASGYHKKQW